MNSINSNKIVSRLRKKRADIEDMDFKSLMALSLKVMQDWRVIAIAVFVIFYIYLAN